MLGETAEGVIALPVAHSGRQMAEGRGRFSRALWTLDLKGKN